MPTDVTQATPLGLVEVLNAEFQAKLGRALPQLPSKS